MRALTYAAYGPIENLVLSDVEAPRPRDGELVVDVTRAALNPKDALFRKGKFKLLSGRSFPKRVGLDYAGVVRESRSRRFQPGDRVFGMLDEYTGRRGTIAEQVRVSEGEAAIVPAEVADEDAAAIALTASTSLQALRDLALVTKGTRVWIHGASGGVGTVAVQIARGLGAEVTTTTSEANLALAKELGAHHTLDYRADYLPELRDRIDVVFDVFGNLEVPAVRDVFAGGRGVFVSTVPAAKRFALEVLSRWSHIQQRLVVVRARHADLTELAAWLRDGRLRAVIDSRYSLARAHEAFAKLESKRTRGKLIIELNPPRWSVARHDTKIRAPGRGTRPDHGHEHRNTSRTRCTSPPEPTSRCSRPGLASNASAVWRAARSSPIRERRPTTPRGAPTESPSTRRSRSSSCGIRRPRCSGCSPPRRRSPRTSRAIVSTREAAWPGLMPTMSSSLRTGW